MKKWEEAYEFLNVKITEALGSSDEYFGVRSTNRGFKELLRTILKKGSWKI